MDAWTTTATGAEHKIEVPATHPVRRVCVQAKTRTATIGGTFSKLDLRVDKGAYSPVIVNSPLDWCMAEVAEYGLQNQVGGIDYVISTSECDLPYRFASFETIDAVPYGYAGEANLEVHFITLPPRVKANTTGGDEGSFTMRGYGFQKCLRIGFDHEYDGFDLLRVPGGKALDLVCTEAAASKVAAAFVQDVVPY